MTMPSERTRAVLQTRRFLLDLQLGNYPRMPKVVRQEAHRLLRHFPNACDIDMARRDKFGLFEIFGPSEEK